MRRVCLRFGFSCLSLVIIMAVVSQTASAQAPKKIVTIEGITEYRLDNGLQVLLFPDPSRPTVTVNLTIFVGSRTEGYGEAGMAHLLEHMLFKGTPLHPDIDKLMQKRGAQFNGTTWLDRTNYFETLPATKEEEANDNLEFALRLEADRMMNSYIRAEDLASEMTVVRNEFERGEDNPSRVLMQRIHAAAFEWHNYGKSTIGNRSDIERVPIPALRAFYRKHYQPDNAMLVIAGKFDEKKALEFTQKYFGAIEKPEREKDTTYTEEPAQDGERTVALRRVGDVGLVGAAYHIPASSHDDFAAVRVLSYILAMEPGGVLYKSLVEPKKAAVVSGYAFGLRDPGLLYMEAEVPRGGGLEDVRKTMLTAVEELGEKGVSDQDTDRAKQQILKERELELANSQQLAVSLSNWASQGDWRLYFLYRDRVEKVTAADVKRVAGKYLQRNNRTVGLFIPTEKPERVVIPSTPDVQALVKDYKGREAIAAGEDFDPSPTNVESRTTRGAIEGIKLALLPKKTRGKSVNLSLTLRYGNGENLKGLVTATEMLPGIMKRGTKDLTHQQIQDELAKNRAELGASGTRGLASFSIQTKRENLPEVLSLLKQILRQPAFDAEEFEVYRREQLAQLEQALTDPQSRGITQLRRTLAPYKKDDVRYIPSIAEDIERYKSVKLSDVKRVYNEYLGTQAGELSVVGDFDPGEIRMLLDDMLADWVAMHPYERIPEVAFPDVPGGRQTIQIPDKANSIYFAGHLMPVADDHPDYAALMIGNFVLGGGGLASRLGERVRQKEGLSYGVGSGLRANVNNPRCSITLYAISAPQNTPKVINSVADEVNKFLKEGITEAELDSAKSGWLQRQNVSRTRDASLASTLNQTLFADRTMKFFEDQEAAVKKLTQEDVIKAFRKHIDPKKLVVVTAGDFTKPEEGGEE